MTYLSDFGVVDIRAKLPRAKWDIGVRQATTSLTWHYNGPSVPADRQFGDGLLAQLIGDARYQMRPGWGGTVNGADGLMYHLVVAADGTVYQTRDLEALLWHCAHADGNAKGLALHFPLGTGQAPTPAQLGSATRITTALCARYGIPLNRVLGHLEWRHMTACPGYILQGHIQSFRAGARPYIVPTVVPAGIRRWRIRADLGDVARVRQKPARFEANGLEVPIAARLKPDTLVYVDAIKQGETIEGKSDWVHMAKIVHEQADLVFLWAGLGTWVSA